MEAWHPAFPEVSSVLRFLLREVALSMVIFAAIYPLCRLLGRDRPALCHALWALVIARLLLPPGLSHPFSLGALAGRWIGPRGDIGGGGASFASGGVELVTLPMPHVPAPETDPVWALVLVGLWLLGCAVSLATLLGRRRRYLYVLRQSASITDPGVLANAERWIETLGIRRRVRLRTSDAKISPFTIGSLRPLVYLPRLVLRDASLRESALAHELAHVARWDSLLLACEQLARVLYFFHPLVWFVGRELAHERERACDALVLSRGEVSARDYARNLLTVAELDLVGLATLNLTTSKRRWTMRIKSILTTRSHPLTAQSRLATQPRLALAVACLLGLVLLPLGGTAASEGAAVGDFGKTGEAWSNPLPGSRVTAAWGNMQDPWTHEKKFHKGIDLAAPSGTPIYSPKAGRVEVATETYDLGESYGTVIVLDHGGGFKTFYAHLGRLEVKAGARVEKGDLVARVGSTGRSTGPHLHFEAWRNGEAVDPGSWIGDWR